MFNCISTDNRVCSFPTREAAAAFVQKEGDKSKLWTLDPAMTEQQILWAASHDWFVCENPNGSVTVMERYTEDGVLFEQPVIFSSLSKLRDWAGY